jgi:hydroxymethylbilane synthase
MTLRIGTRGSALALWQARHVADLLRGIPTELVEIQTVGDQIHDVPLVQLGGEGAFTKAIQQALLEERIDIAVHSLKDLPTFHVRGLVLVAVPPRGPTGDAFVSLKHQSFDALPADALVASSSLRRKAQLLHRRPDLKVVDIRGNVETRLRKLTEGTFDATILARAGLMRLALGDRITEILDGWMLPAVGQGALGIECRTEDEATCQILSAIDDPLSRSGVLAERAMLRGLGGGCHVPIGVRSDVAGDSLSLRGAVFSPDGTRRIDAEITGRMGVAEALGATLARQLRERGAEKLLAM